MSKPVYLPGPTDPGLAERWKAECSSPINTPHGPALEWRDIYHRQSDPNRAAQTYERLVAIGDGATLEEIRAATGLAQLSDFLEPECNGCGAHGMGM